MGVALLSPAGVVEVDDEKQGGATAVPLFDAEDLALLPRVRPEVDWRAVRRTHPAAAPSSYRQSQPGDAGRLAQAPARRQRPAEGFGAGAVFDRAAVPHRREADRPGRTTDGTVEDASAEDPPWGRRRAHRALDGSSTVGVERLTVPGVRPVARCGSRG
ncbi:hypothetical protein [Streptomyces sp. C]|uniref:hypothetical protein n=1 Tax=Streptomyces sp. C TaxID=253839 RepID=UPI0001B581AA|nr:hypothetical protein [Streptomyces sp. C]